MCCPASSATIVALDGPFLGSNATTEARVSPVWTRIIASFPEMQPIIACATRRMLAKAPRAASERHLTLQRAVSAVRIAGQATIIRTSLIYPVRGATNRAKCCNLLGTCCLFNLVPTFPQSSPFQAWGLDPRKRRDAHGHASTYSGDQGAAQSDGARFKVERSLARIFGDTPSQSPAEEMWRPRQALADDETYADTVGSSPLDRLTRHATVAFRSQSTSILSCAARRLTIATWFVI
jgi:hypothetical protein